MPNRNPPVSEVMSTALVAVDARDDVAAAERAASSAGVHHLLVARGGKFVGLVCLCDLRDGEPAARVEDRMRSLVVALDARCSIERAARLMMQSGIGMLPLLDPSQCVMGVVTRRDLRRAGALPNLPGVDRCASCGDGHELEPCEEPSDVVFCKPCRESVRAPASSFEAITLGGEG